MNPKRFPCLLLASLALGLSIVGCNGGDSASDADTQAAMNSRNAQRGGGAPGGAPPKSGAPTGTAPATGTTGG